jgi:hypothetical protein
MKHLQQVVSSAALAGFLALSSACSSTTGGTSASSSNEPATNTVAQTATSGATGSAEDDPRVCERIIPTGTRIAQRVCFKQSEWDQMRANAQQAAEDSQRRAVQQGNPTGN